MKSGSKKVKLEFRRQRLTIWAMTVHCILLFNVSQTFAQNTTSTDFATAVPATAGTTRKLCGGNITNFGYGGPAIKFSRFNNQFAFMTGGRGSITINNRYTIGGGGYGIANSIKLPGSSPDTTRNFKMGYGGIELGYIDSALNRFMWLHTGISYRYVHHAHLDYISDQNIRGFSFYVGLLFGKS